MARIIVSEFLTLDGVMEEPMWSLTYWNDEVAKFKNDELFSAEAQLLGRVTYEGFAASWPLRSGDPFTDQFNAMPKYVVSNTLTSPEWNNSHVIAGDGAKEVAALRQRVEGDLVVYGSGKLTESLMKAGLVDRFNLLVYPLILGKGKRFIEEGASAKLKLIESRAMGSGVVLLVYEPDASA